MAWKWFVQRDGLVSGPLNSNEVEEHLRSGYFLAENLVWGPGLELWQNLQSWQRSLPNLSPTTHSEVRKDTWHFAVGGQSRGPMAHQTLVLELKALPSLGDVMIWTKGMKEWAPLFEFHDLLAAVGVNKRQFPRSDLTGKAILKTDGLTLIANLQTISEGGFGIHLDGGGLVTGQVVSVELQSPAFREPLHAKAEVRYIFNGVLGMKFTNINVEARGTIIQFIKQNQIRFNIKAA